MSLFGRKKESQAERLNFDPQEKYPMIRASICTGEQVGGLKNRKTGAFEEVMVIRGPQDLARFKQMTGTDDIPKEY